MNTENTRYGAEKIDRMLAGAKKLFFVGIGGINMCSLAVIAASRGFIVSGSDRSPSPVTKALTEDGIKVYHTHSKENVAGADALIYTVSIPCDNPEYTEAARMGIPRISRADFLGWLMKDAVYRIGVSGMHGKSTVTSMIASILLEAGVDPTISSGAVLPALGRSYHAGENKYFLFEACEYKDSFLSFYPNIAVVLNIDMDHPDYFKSIPQIKESFRRYMSISAAADGVAIVNWSDENVRDACRGSGCRLIKFGTSLDTDVVYHSEYNYYADKITLLPRAAEFLLYENGAFAAAIRLSEGGLHNVRDAVAAAAACRASGISMRDIKRGLEAFRGAARRMEFVGKTSSGADIFLDYAHHPTEIKVTLEAAKTAGGKIICIYQPHTYSRTAALFDGFASALSIADEVILADIYAARETNDSGISSERLADAVNEAGGNAVYTGAIQKNHPDSAVYTFNPTSHAQNSPTNDFFPHPPKDEFVRAARFAAANARAGDTIIVMGAGDIYETADILKNM